MTATIVDEAQAAGEGQARRRGGMLYLCATVLSQASALLRYVALARLLGPEQLGLAAALTVTAGFFDLISDTGSDRFLIQDRDGNTPAAQRLVQLVMLVRGVGVAGAIALFAIPVAGFYGTPGLAAGLVLIALSPLIGGLLNLDMRRVQREHDFRPEAICMLAADSTGLIGAVLAAWLTRDFRAVAYGLIARSAVQVLCSHLVARRPFRLGWDAAHARALARFAAPLMLNGLMLFILSQGDRVIVAHRLGVTELGYYAAVILLIYYPSGVIGNYLHAIATPVIATRRGAVAERNRASDRLGGQTLLLGLAMAAGFAVIAPPAVPILFGAGFAQPPLLIGLIGVLQATRFILIWPTTVALALGRSRTVLYGNIAHLLIFPGALAGIWLIGGLTGIVAGFLGGELLAAAFALVLLNGVLGRALWHGFDRFLALVASAGVIVGWDLALQAGRWSFALCMVLLTVGLLGWLARREAAVIAEAVIALRRMIAARRLRPDLA